MKTVVTTLFLALALASSVQAISDPNIVFLPNINHIDCNLEWDEETWNIIPDIAPGGEGGELILGANLYGRYDQQCCWDNPQYVKDNPWSFDDYQSLYFGWADPSIIAGVDPGTLGYYGYDRARIDGVSGGPWGSYTDGTAYPSLPECYPKKNMTIEGWFKFDSALAAYFHPVDPAWWASSLYPNPFWIIISSDFDPGWWLMVDRVDDDEVRLRMKIGAPYEYFESAGTISTGVWHHIAVVHDGDNQELRYYVDGTETDVWEMADEWVSTSAGYGAAGSWSQGMFFGQCTPGPDGYCFRGCMTDFRLSNAVVDPVDLGYNSGPLLPDVPPYVPADCADAISHGYVPTADLVPDCHIDLLDFAFMAQYFLQCYDPTDPTCLTPWLE